MDNVVIRGGVGRREGVVIGGLEGVDGIEEIKMAG